MRTWVNYLQENSTIPTQSVKFSPHNCRTLTMWVQSSCDIIITGVSWTGTNTKQNSYLSISRPGQRGALRWLGFAVGADHLLSEFIDDDLPLEVLQEQNTHIVSKTWPKRHRDALTSWSELSETASFIITGLQTAFGFRHRISHADFLPKFYRFMRNTLNYPCLRVLWCFNDLT